MSDKETVGALTVREAYAIHAALAICLGDLLGEETISKSNRKLARHLVELGLLDEPWDQVALAGAIDRLILRIQGCIDGARRTGDSV